MTYDDFKAKHKTNVLRGFDDLDGRDYWAEFKADLHVLLAEERKAVASQVGESRKMLNEFTQDPRVCQAIAKDCVGGHQEDPCKCLYCRARALICRMDD